MRDFFNGLFSGLLLGGVGAALIVFCLLHSNSPSEQDEQPIVTTVEQQTDVASTYEKSATTTIEQQTNAASTYEAAEAPTDGLDDSFFFENDPVEIELADSGNGYLKITKGVNYLKQQFTTIAPGHVWQNVKADLEKSTKDSIVISKAELDQATTGSLLATKQLEDTTVLVTVPEIRVEGVRTTELDRYGLVEVFQIEGSNQYHFQESDSYFASADLYFYDRSLLTDTSPLVIYGEDCWAVTSPLPYPLKLALVSEDFPNLEQKPSVYTARVVSCSCYGCGIGGPVNDDQYIRFTTNWIDLDTETYQDLVKKTEEFHVGTRIPTAKHWNANQTSYDLLGLLDDDTGKFAGELKLVEVEPNLYYIKPDHLPSILLVIESDAIRLAATGNMIINLGEDKLWLGEYFRDQTKNPEMVRIEGTNLTLTRATADALLSLLDEKGINWWTLSLPSSAIDHN